MAAINMSDAQAGKPCGRREPAGAQDAAVAGAWMAARSEGLPARHAGAPVWVSDAAPAVWSQALQDVAQVLAGQVPTELA